MSDSETPTTETPADDGGEALADASPPDEEATEAAEEAADGDAPADEKAAGGALSAAALEVDDVFANAEPWDPIETKIVLGSFAAAIFFLVVFGILINIYLLD